MVEAALSEDRKKKTAKTPRLPEDGKKQLQYLNTNGPLIKGSLGYHQATLVSTCSAVASQIYFEKRE